ncbi:hypothetical protein GCM10008949_23420 [Deinococcus humi]|nr:hypothetical protein GCM10008949_23420 [Deinococcus humi]
MLVWDLKDCSQLTEQGDRCGRRWEHRRDALTKLHGRQWDAAGKVSHWRNKVSQGTDREPCHHTNHRQTWAEGQGAEDGRGILWAQTEEEHRRTIDDLLVTLGHPNSGEMFSQLSGKLGVAR